jgi:hypothetical protein
MQDHSKSLIESLERRTMLSFVADVNFQQAGAAAFGLGYLVDGGAVYGGRGNGFTYGWNIDNTANARTRNASNSPDKRYDTLNHMQLPAGTNARWEIAVPNGKYWVKLVAGDPIAYNSVYRINVENTLVVSGTPTSTNRWIEGNATITVTDGRLTLTNAAGSSNNKVCYINIQQLAQDVVVDDNTGAAVKTGTWESRTGGNITLDTYGASYLNDGNWGKGTKRVTFTPTLPEAGNYQVYVRTPNWGAGAANAVPHDIRHTGGTSTVYVNQQTSQSQWVLLGTYNFAAGTGGSVVVRNDGTSGYVLADVVRFVKEDVSVDFTYAGETPTHRGTGILHSFSAVAPDPVYVNPLNPNMFRVMEKSWGGDPNTGAFASYSRMRQYTAHIQLVVSDSWGYDRTDFPGDGGNWTPWETVVANLAQRAVNAGNTYEWDIWNEPDTQFFWPRSRTQFFEAWRRAFIQIRSRIPNATIVGPSIAVYSDEFLQSFLTFARNNNCLPNVLSWHQIPESTALYYDPGRGTTVTDRIARLKSWMAANAINITRFSVNEYINESEQTKPGTVVWMLDDLERAKVESAAHACWNDPSGGFNGFNQSLDGLLTPAGDPRSTWWTYKAYGELTGKMTRIDPDRGTVRGVASFDPVTREARFVLGREMGARGGTISVPVTLAHLTHTGMFAEGERVKIVATRIADSGANALYAPAATVDTTGVISRGTLRLTLPGFGPSDAYSVLIAKAPTTNLVTNSGFETGAGQTVTGWSTWAGPTGQHADADFIERPAAPSHSGSFNGAHWKASPHEVWTGQTITGLADGIYTLRAWIRTSGGPNYTTYMDVANYSYGGGTARTTGDLYSTTGWTLVQINNIAVRGGSAKIGFYSKDTAGGNWLAFDDVEFFRTA